MVSDISAQRQRRSAREISSVRQFDDELAHKISCKVHAAIPGRHLGQRSRIRRKTHLAFQRQHGIYVGSLAASNVRNRASVQAIQIGDDKRLYARRAGRGIATMLSGTKHEDKVKTWQQR